MPLFNTVFTQSLNFLKYENEIEQTTECSFFFGGVINQLQYSRNLLWTIHLSHEFVGRQIVLHHYHVPKTEIVIKNDFFHFRSLYRFVFTVLIHISIYHAE